MLTRIVRFQIQGDFIQLFLKATAQHALKSREELGITRFEAFQDVSDPGVFFLVITFKDEESRAHHFETVHYKAWHAKVSPMFSAPVEGASCTSLIA